jgi:hypothetical protein
MTQSSRRQRPAAARPGAVPRQPAARPRDAAITYARQCHPSPTVSQTAHVRARSPGGSTRRMKDLSAASPRSQLDGYERADRRIFARLCPWCNCALGSAPGWELPRRGCSITNRLALSQLTDFAGAPGWVCDASLSDFARENDARLCCVAGPCCYRSAIWTGLEPLWS